MGKAAVITLQRTVGHIIGCDPLVSDSHIRSAWKTIGSFSLKGIRPKRHVNAAETVSFSLFQKGTRRINLLPGKLAIPSCAVFLCDLKRNDAVGTPDSREPALQRRRRTAIAAPGYRLIGIRNNLRAALGTGKACHFHAPVFLGNQSVKIRSVSRVSRNILMLVRILSALADLVHQIKLPAITALHLLARNVEDQLASAPRTPNHSNSPFPLIPTHFTQKAPKSRSLQCS